MKAKIRKLVESAPLASAARKERAPRTGLLRRTPVISDSHCIQVAIRVLKDDGGHDALIKHLREIEQKLRDQESVKASSLAVSALPQGQHQDSREVWRERTTEGI